MASMKAAVTACKNGKWKRGHKSFPKCVGAKMRGGKLGHHRRHHKRR